MEVVHSNYCRNTVWQITNIDLLDTNVLGLIKRDIIAID